MTKTQALQAIEDDIIRNLKCPLKDAAHNLVFGKGNPDAPIMFIGEAPGEQEDLQGLPFVGSAGKQLDKMLQSIDLTLDACYVANILKYRPPNNREPQPDEMLRHTPYLIKQIDTIKPQVIVTLGNFSTKFVLSGFSVEQMYSIEGVGKLHGKIKHVTIDGRDCVVIPLYHPAACLYNPNLREMMMQDFQIISQFLKTGNEAPAAKPAEKITAHDLVADFKRESAAVKSKPNDLQAAKNKVAKEASANNKQTRWNANQTGLDSFK